MPVCLKNLVFGTAHAFVLQGDRHDPSGQVINGGIIVLEDFFKCGELLFKGGPTDKIALEG